MNVWQPTAMTYLFLKPFNLDSMPAALSSRRFCSEARRRESSICLSRAFRFAFFPFVFARRALDRYTTLLIGMNQCKRSTPLSQHYDQREKKCFISSPGFGKHFLFILVHIDRIGSGRLGLWSGVNFTRSKLARILRTFLWSILLGLILVIQNLDGKIVYMMVIIPRASRSAPYTARQYGLQQVQLFAIGSA